MRDWTGSGTLQNTTYGAISQSVKIMRLQHKWKILFQSKAAGEVQSHKQQQKHLYQHARVHCLAHEHYCQLTMEQLPAHNALSGLCPPKRGFLPTAEPCAEQGSILQMAATAARVVKAAESIALVFLKRLLTRDAYYFTGVFQKLNPCAVLLHLFVYRKMMHYSKLHIRTKC